MNAHVRTRAVAAALAAALLLLLPAPLASAAVPAGKPIPHRFLEALCETPPRQLPVLRSTASPAGGTKLLQYSLRFLDYPVGPVDGVYGKVTRAAVRAYQRDKRLVVDGITGPQTWRSLQRVVCFP